ncbi:hypothetical protein HZH68_014193 [Vespula germanica]|uniref:Uncharacterized protein n=1 Tax=Vespula germanica TaxID=30212 RepID=A0A834JBK7_VESGE|nr:hypothetical protein HZH68_014193 [Vespula germanica]
MKYSKYLNNQLMKFNPISVKGNKRSNFTTFFKLYGQENKNLLVSDDSEFTVRIWNLDNLFAIMAYSYQNIHDSMFTKQNTIIVDWCLKDLNMIYCISTDGLLISWNVLKVDWFIMRHIWTYGTGSASYKLNGHDTKIYSLSWCPVEYNILNNENNRDVVLDSDVKDKSIFLCRAKVEMAELKLLLTSSFWEEFP